MNSGPTEPLDFTTRVGPMDPQQRCALLIDWINGAPLPSSCLFLLPGSGAFCCGSSRPQPFLSQVLVRKDDAAELLSFLKRHHAQEAGPIFDALIALGAKSANELASLSTIAASGQAKQMMRAMLLYSVETGAIAKEVAMSRAAS